MDVFGKLLNPDLGFLVFDININFGCFFVMVKW